MRIARKSRVWLAIMTMTLSGCSGVVTGQATSPSAPSPLLAPGQVPTAADLCRLMTPADFPVQGQVSPGSPKLEEKYSPSCRYHVKTGGIGETISVSLSFIPESKLNQGSFKGRTEMTVAGKRTAVGQGIMKGESGECDLAFDSPAGEWLIVVIDDSAPNRDGCAAAKHVAERVIPRIP
ncbi:hypothetical protein GCM10022247_32600 [Allokutzneria multivorans]|uniref:DUF3558 domain-containing protein n=1 Tax=Allokutzneria multivorans TaxID=1142134 RepID=A0ABP7S826_9PSEU